MTNLEKKPYCEECLSFQKIRADGKLIIHRSDGYLCEGSLKEPMMREPTVVKGTFRVLQGHVL